MNDVTAVECAFCRERLKLPLHNPSLCPRCEIGVCVAASEGAARELIAAVTGQRAGALQIVSMPMPAGGRKHVYFGWDNDEAMSTTQAARILNKSHQVVQTHVRPPESRFPGAHQTETMRDGTPRFWRIPRASLLSYMAAGRKGYTLSRTGAAARRIAAGKRKTRKK